jgi:DNA-binding CsgD family transcriptional regulator
MPGWHPRRSGTTGPGSSPLSAREREVAALIAQGKTNGEIAAALVVGKRTVETHVGNILGKLGLSSRAQIVAWAIANGLLSSNT